MFIGIPLVDLKNSTLSTYLFNTFKHYISDAIQYYTNLTLAPISTLLPEPTFYTPIQPSIPNYLPRLLASLSPNQSLSQLDFIDADLVGAGAFGRIYRALNKNNNTTVILKILTRNQTTRTAIANEIKILNHLKSVCQPYILCYLDYFEDPSYYYLLTEFLGNYIDMSKYPLTGLSDSLVSQIITNLTMGLFQIHSFGVAHRDIKPNNIMINPSNFNIKYIDFGLSCFAPDCRTKIITGSFLYVAPELLYKRTDPFDLWVLQLADIWSLGMTILNLLLGQSYYIAFRDKYILPNINPDIRNKIVSWDKLNIYTISLTANLLLQTSEPLLIRPLLPNSSSLLARIENMLHKNPTNRTLFS